MDRGRGGRISNIFYRLVNGKPSSWTFKTKQLESRNKKKPAFRKLQLTVPFSVLVLVCDFIKSLSVIFLFSCFRNGKRLI